MMMPGGMGWGGGWGYGGGLGMLFGGVFMLLFWGLIIAGVVVGVRWLVQQGDGGRRRDTAGSALEILRQRYARGEIDREEFEARKRDLVA